MRTLTQPLNMSPGGIPPVIHVSQYDSDFTIVFTLFSTVGDFTIEAGTTAMVRGTKSSGTGYSADATINISAKTVTVTGNQQMTAAAGQNVFEITLLKGGKEISSKNFILLCERAALDADTITDESVLKELNAIIESADTATQAAEEAEDAADRAEAAAQTFVIDSTPTQGSNNAVRSGGVWSALQDIQIDADAVPTPNSTNAVQSGGTWNALNGKVSKPTTNPDGTAGQVLRTNGDGTTTWASVGLPTDEQTAEAVSDWLDAHPEATTTVQDGAVTSAKLANALTIAKIDSYVTPQQYGAVGDGVADDTSAFVSMENSAKSIVYIPEGVYKVSGWTTAKSVIMDDKAWLTTDTDKADVIVINGSDQVYALNLRLKNTYAHYGVKVNGDRNHFKMIRIDGLNYDGVTLYPDNKINAGVAVFGTFNTFDFVKLNDFVQDYAGNDSAPQGFVFGNTANYNYLADYHINNCHAGVVSAGLAGTVNRIGSMAVHGCGDNGLYCVGGGHTEVGTFFHQGTNECLAVITDGATASTSNSELTNVQVGTIICKGNTGFSFPVRIKNAGEIKIGSLFVNGEVEAIIFSNRDTIKNAGIDIANLVFDGTARFAFFLPAERGPLDYLMIGRAIIKDNHADSSSTLIGDANYMLVDMASKISIDRLDLTILDKEGAYTSQSLRPRMILNSALVDSFIGRITCAKPADASGLRLDIINAVQDGITHTHGYFQYNDAENKITHYSNNRYSDVLYSRLIPQYGAWKAGVIVHTDREQTVNEGVVGFACVASGTPGTWRELRVFPSTGIVRYYNNQLQYSKYENGSLSWAPVPTT